jgi:hypothetical protein
MDERMIQSAAVVPGRRDGRPRAAEWHPARGWE